VYCELQDQETFNHKANLILDSDDMPCLNELLETCANADAHIS
jgi:hypothetical protein